MDPKQDISGHAAQDKKMQSGVRALANLLLLEHDFRRAPKTEHLARLVVDRLSRFTSYDCAVFWTVSRGKSFQQAFISGVGDEPDGKAMRKWGVKLSKWLAKAMAKTKQPMLIDPDTIEDKVFDLWPETVPLNGLAVPVKNPKGEILGGVVLLREAPWTQSFRVMMDQMAEAVGYSLRALALGMHGRRPSKGRWITLILVVLLTAGSFFVPMPVNIDVKAELAVGNGNIPGISAPRGPAQIDLMIPVQDSLALKPGTRLQARFQGEDYKLIVERVTPWYAALFADRRVRTRLLDAPDGLAPPGLESVTVSNTTTPLPFYLLRGPWRSIREAVGIK